MATISQRITLDGAEDIRKKLEELGKAGEQAFKQIQDAAKKPIVDPAQIDRSKQAFDQLAAAAQKTGSAIEQAGQQAETAGRSIGAGLGPAARNFTIAATAIVFAISAVVRSLTSGAGETAQEISTQAERLMITIPQWLKLRGAIEAAGGEVEDFVKSARPLAGALAKLSLDTSGLQIQTFADGTSVAIHSMTTMSKETAAAVAELSRFNVTLADIQKGDVAAMMEKIAAAIAKMPEGAAKAAAGVKFFGPNWRQAVADLTAGKNAIDDTVGAMGQMRIASRQMSETQVKDSKEAADQWDSLGKAIRAIKDQIGAMFAGTSFARAEWLTNMVDDARILLTTFLKLKTETQRANFLAGLGDSAAATTFKILVALGQQLAGVWDVLTAAGGKLMAIFDGIAGIFEGITGSQVAAFFITAAIAAAGLALALKGIALVLTPLTALMSLVFGPFGPLLLVAAAAAALFWDKLKAGAQTVAALIPQELAGIGDSIKKLFAGDFSGFWDQFASNVVSAFQKIAAAAEADQGVVGQVFRGIKEIITDLPGAIELVAKALLGLGSIAKGVASIINFIFGTDVKGTGVALFAIVLVLTGGLAALAAVGTIVGATFGVIAAAIAILSPILGTVGAAVTVLAVVFATLAAAVIAIRWDSISATGVAAWNAVTGAIGGAVSAVGNFAISIATIVWDTISGAGVAAWNAVTGAINRAIEAIRSFLGLKGGGAVPAAERPGFARGGLLGGRGSGTSDSNLAWVSRGEHIMPAGAVRQPGVLAFLEALRRSGGDLSRVLDQMGHFATGGLVGMPALAGGGLGSMSHVTIQFPGGPTIGGLRASSQVVEELQRAAAMAQVRSGGRKPSRYT